MSVNYKTYSLLSSATLTALLADNLKIRPTFGATNLILHVRYTPAQNNRLCTILVEFSSGTYQQYQSGTLIWVSSTVLLAEDTTGTQKALENPITITGTSSGTTYARKLDIAGINRNVRISAKEDGAANFGTISIDGTFY